MALRRNTVVGTMADAINYVAARASDPKSLPLLAVMRAVGAQVDILNFEVTPSLNRFLGMLRTGGTVAIRLAAVTRLKGQGPLCMQITVPHNVGDFEVIYFGGLKPDGTVAVHAVRPRDVKKLKSLSVPLE